MPRPEVIYDLKKIIYIYYLDAGLVKKVWSCKGGAGKEATCLFTRLESLVWSQQGF